MKSLLNKTVINQLQHRFEAATRLLLFIDFDHVLKSPLEKNTAIPLDPQDRELLREVSEKNAITLAIFSNHSMAVLKKMVGFSGIYLVANNGMEISGPDLNVVHAEAKRARQELEPRIHKILEQVSELPGVTLENREYSLALNISKAKAAIQRRARLLMEQAWTSMIDTFTLLEMRNELILRPRVGWSKNRALMFIWNKFASPRRRPVVIYIGSDESDEEIFSMLGREGIGVVVGGTNRVARSKAAYYLKNRNDVKKFMTWLSQNISLIKVPNVPV